MVTLLTVSLDSDTVQVRSKVTRSLLPLARRLYMFVGTKAQTQTNHSMQATNSLFSHSLIKFYKQRTRNSAILPSPMMPNSRICCLQYWNAETAKFT